MFVKTRADAAPGEFPAEAAGLAWLSGDGDVRTPEVLAVRDEPPRLLALEWVDAGSPGAAGETELGRGLAAMHGRGADGHGAPPPGGSIQRLGALELSLGPAASWAEFYADQRLLPLARQAHARGSLGADGLRSVEAVAARIDDLAGPPEPPSRLHGDLWSGNVHWDSSGAAWLIDPAPLGGHREIDLAMLELFGPRSRRLLDAYQEVSPLQEGWEERVGLWQLFPLLVHAVLFGGHYGHSVQQVAARYVA